MKIGICNRSISFRLCSSMIRKLRISPSIAKVSLISAYTRYTCGVIQNYGVRESVTSRNMSLHLLQMKIGSTSVAYLLLNIGKIGSSISMFRMILLQAMRFHILQPKKKADSNSKLHSQQARMNPQRITSFPRLRTRKGVRL